MAYSLSQQDELPLVPAMLDLIAEAARCEGGLPCDLGRWRPMPVRPALRGGCLGRSPGFLVSSFKRA